MMKDDYIRALRGLLKEIVRVALKFDFPFVCFCEALCSDKADRINLINKFDFQLKVIINFLFVFISYFLDGILIFFRKDCTETLKI